MWCGLIIPKAINVALKLLKLCILFKSANSRQTSFLLLSIYWEHLLLFNMWWFYCHFNLSCLLSGPKLPKCLLASLLCCQMLPSHQALHPPPRTALLSCQNPFWILGILGTQHSISLNEFSLKALPPLRSPFCQTSFQNLIVSLYNFFLYIFVLRHWQVVSISFSQYEINYIINIKATERKNLK